ncbi:phenylalanyl-tRNA ligase subunit beta [Methanocaldococcus villosus KIN24-T80]|uniref:Phenylalanine--tRNA ligase beta subunit n=1 Tax=Methanocaldococcus villosus KIN24-T80 TaxID=1069083 RepID=N6VRA6_9EURY|nr:phenylalanine--tRNA ligase subunit beta [Methanocaldococcus villosus]ENN96435.1 phenylalanyl-tRNA ligase subunit beta [Methanocaldococcus villosus KIN24-T80]
MPTVNVKKYDLERLVNMPLDDKFIEDKFPMMGVEVEEIREEEGEKLISFSVNPNRPDYLSVEGLARGFRGFIGIDPGMSKYDVEKSDVKLYVENVKTRPYIAMALIKGIVIDNYVLESIINLQEKLHWVIGRDRKKVAIGIHDFDKVKPPFYYKEVDNISFVPLGYNEEMSAEEILEKHEKGIKYRHLIKGKYPIILDSEGNVLSFPPIINSELTRVTERTRNLLIDVTGTDKVAVEKTLNILVTALAERKYSKIHSVEVIGKEREIYPKLKEETIVVNPDYINKILGTKLQPGIMINYLRRAKLDAVFSENKLIVYIPPYRVDIFSEVDIAEEIAIAYGYDKFKGVYPEIATIGELDKLEKRCDFIREIMIGLGFYEVINLILTNEKVLFEKMKLKGDYIEVLKPASIEHRILRTSILPLIMETLKINEHKELPIKIFEIGDCVILDGNRVREIKKIAGAIMSNETNYSEIKSHVEALLRELRIDYEIDRYDHPSFIKGRCAKIIKDKRVIGYFGEIDPEVLTNFDLEFPVSAFELLIE